MGKGGEVQKETVKKENGDADILAKVIKKVHQSSRKIAKRREKIIYLIFASAIVEYLLVMSMGMLALHYIGFLLVNRCLLCYFRRVLHAEGNLPAGQRFRSAL